jgi:glycosyltransferase involved in cell wall biosynthesis
MGMQKVDYVKMVKDIWDVEITQKQWENIVNKHQNIIKEYNTQKSIFGFNMKVSIVIPAYNQAQWLPEAIESAINQTIPCEVIVVNDGSPDNTSEIAKMYPVRLVEKENGGLSSARNAGIKEATGQWILTLDSDDKIAPDFVEKCLEYKDEYDIIGTGQQEFGDSNRGYFFKTNPTHEDFKQNNQINCCSLFRKEIWEKIGGYDETMRLGYEDWDYWLRATKAGYKVITIPEYLFFYRKHGESMVSTAIKHHNELMQYMLSKL